MINKLLLILSAVLSFSFISCKSSHTEQPTVANVFSKFDYDKVVAYNYDGSNDIEIIDKDNGQLASRIKKQIVLNKSQVTKITNELCDKSSYGGDIAACFDPHLGIVFYKLNRPVAYISVCLDCNYLVSFIKIPG